MSSLGNLQRDGCWSNWTDESAYPYQVLWTGTSHIYRTIIPQLLYNDYGLETLSVSTAGQTCAHTLAILEDIPNLNEFELVVLDLFAFLRPYTYDSDYNHTLRTTQPELISDSRRSNLLVHSSAPIRQLAETNPKKYIRLLGEKEMDLPVQYCFSLFNSHSQYLRMNRGNYEQLNERFSRHKNYDPSLLFIPQSNPFEQGLPDMPDVRLNEQCESYLMDIIKLCKTEKVPLLLTAIPYRVSPEARIVLEQIAQIAEENGVDFLPMETICDEAWIEWDEDFMDAGHTNHYGSTKVTDFFGAYLSHTYDLEDRSIDPPADSPFLQNEDGYQIAQTLMNFRHRPHILTDYLEALYDLDDSYLLLFTTGTARGLDIHEDVWDILRNLCIDIPDAIPEEGFSLMHVGTASSVIAQSTHPEDALYASVDQASFRLSAAEGDIRVNHESVSGNQEDSHLVIYDLCSHSAVESISLNGEPDATVQRYLH